jgi:hypothetical protein
MSPVYIDCHGLRQFSKILFELTRCGMDKNDLSFSDCVETNTKNNKSFALFRVTILASDPSLLHEFLIDNLPIPSRFITCMDYDEYDADYIQNMMIPIILTLYLLPMLEVCL